MSGKRGPGQAWWQSHLDAIAREGIDTTAYAKREGLAVSNLYYWRRRLKAQQHDRPTEPHAQVVQAPERLFVPVTVQAPVASMAGYVLELGSELRLSLPALPSPQWLAQVRQALAPQVR